jgi:ADP-ribosyl-[dinitrogen reductase] hydrolase
MIDRIERYRGCLLGLAAGDALGTTLEFHSPGTFPPLEDMTGGGPFHLQPGEWTDDTSMALCLAESLVECHAFDPRDQMERYLRWYRQGHLSSNGRCFDIGITVREALARFERSGEPFSGSTDPYSAGNGSLMRLAPVVLFFDLDAEQAIHYAGESSRTTHGAEAAIDACRYFAGLLVGALLGESKETLLSQRYCPLPDYWQAHPFVPEIDEIACGTFKTRQPPQIQGSGYVVRSLEAALWAFHHADSFRQGCLLAANLGDDADTTAAIYGQLAGAYYGEQSIPTIWRELLAQRELIEKFAGNLYRLSEGHIQP